MVISNSSFGNINPWTIGGEYTDKIDEDSEEFQLKKKTKVMKKDMNEIAKDLEKIRDLVMLNGDQGGYSSIFLPKHMYS